MKLNASTLLMGMLGLGLASAWAQPRMGGAPHGPRLGAATAKLFGDNQTFSADLEFQAKPADGEEMTMPGKMAFDHGKSRFEMDLTQAKSARLNAQAAAQMKSMGMDKMVAITRPDKKVSYLVYPGMQAYVETPIQDPQATQPESNYKVDLTELGKDTVDGHPCIKNKAVVTDKDGNKHESTIWNATDLKKFPVKIVQNQEGNDTTMLFKNVSFSAPDASQFDPPSGFTKYDSMQAMMQQVMMKRFGGGMGGMMPGRRAGPPPNGQ